MAASLEEDVIQFIARYGCRPGPRTALGRRLGRQLEMHGDFLRDKLDGLKIIHGATLKRASLFLRRSERGLCLDSGLSRWAANIRYRWNIGSDLSRALAVSIKGNLRPRIIRKSAGKGMPLETTASVSMRRKRKQKVNVSRGTSQGVKVADGTSHDSGGALSSGSSCHSTLDLSGAIPVLRRSDSPSVPLAPPFVVDWVYQAIVDTCCILEQVLGCGSFDEAGKWVGSGCGEVVLFWGTHLGAARDQAMIAWDYDGDLAVFLREGMKFASLWQLVQIPLAKLGYKCVQHSKHKYRVSPSNPLCWAPFKELYQELRESMGGSRPDILRRCAKQWNAGKRPHQPHGSNCIDIEVYEDEQWRSNRSALQIAGTKPLSVSPASLFPTCKGAFGPLLLKLPRTVGVLYDEYGRDCMTIRRLKAVNKGGHAKVQDGGLPDSVRRSAWPYTQLLRVPSHYWS